MPKSSSVFWVSGVLIVIAGAMVLVGPAKFGSFLKGSIMPTEQQKMQAREKAANKTRNVPGACYDDGRRSNVNPSCSNVDDGKACDTGIDGMKGPWALFERAKSPDGVALTYGTCPAIYPGTNFFHIDQEDGFSGPNPSACETAYTGCVNRIGTAEFINPASNVKNPLLSPDLNCTIVLESPNDARYQVQSTTGCHVYCAVLAKCEPKSTPQAPVRRPNGN